MYAAARVFDENLITRGTIDDFSIAAIENSILCRSERIISIRFFRGVLNIADILIRWFVTSSMIWIELFTADCSPCQRLVS